MRKSAFRSPLDLVYVDKCALCRKPCGNVLCDDCAKKLKPIGSFCCIRCGKPLGSCTCRELEPEFKRCVSAFRYEDAAVSALILKLKSSGSRKISELLALNVADKIRSELSDEKFDFVTYVPASALDVKRKGFDHAQILAESISNLLDISLIKPPVRRRGLAKQKYQTAKDRKKNLSKKYVLRSRSHLFGNVLLIDDVMTTGATLTVCSEIIKAAGAQKVFCATAATSVKNK